MEGSEPWETKAKQMTMVICQIRLLTDVMPTDGRILYSLEPMEKAAIARTLLERIRDKAQEALCQSPMTE